MDNNTNYKIVGNLTLHDFYAGLALLGILTHNGATLADLNAKKAFENADAMLQRKKILESKENR